MCNLFEPTNIFLKITKKSGKMLNVLCRAILKDLTSITQSLNIFEKSLSDISLCPAGTVNLAYRL